MENNAVKRWVYSILFMFICLSVPLLVFRYSIIPLYLWIAYDVSYEVPVMSQVLRLLAVAGITSVTASTLAYFFRGKL